MSSPFASRRPPQVAGYQTLDLIGEGGGGQVYAAKDKKSGTKVAVKVLYSDGAKNAQAVDGFLKTAEAFTKVRHTNLVEVIKSGRLADGAAYLVMSHIDGRVLGDVLVDTPTFPAKRAVAIARQLCGALGAVHAACYVYLDLKPTNIFICKTQEGSEQVKLFDVDMAMRIGSTNPRSTASGAKQLLGTPEYWSPEQSCGAALEVQSDIYSLGILLYELLSGKLPFVSQTYSDIIEAHVHRKAPELTSPSGPLPLALKKIVSRCLAKDPDDRFDNTMDLEEALSKIKFEEEDKVSPAAHAQLPMSANVGLSASLAIETTKSEGLAPGTVVGSYRLIEMLGQGGMGFVYRAEHTRISRKVAIKMLRPEFASNPKAVERFFSEAKAANQIAHENIVEITDFVEDDKDYNYVIMELLKGRELSDALGDEKFPLARSLGIAVQMCDALSAVHDAGIVHRDLKPENIFLTRRSGQRDFVKILDFGIAKLTDRTGLSTSNTAAGAVFGTPDYMSPEQARGTSVDHRSDIYGFGVILFEMVTGTKLFDAPTFAEVLVMQMKTEPPTPSSANKLMHAIPPELEEIILQCLEKDPNDRPDKMEEVGKLLMQVAGSISQTLEAFTAEDHFYEETMSTVTLSGQSKMGKWIVAGAGVAVLAAAALYFAGQSEGPADTSASEMTEVAALASEQAAAEAAEAAEAAAKAMTVDVAFASTPAGAEVYRAGSETVLGTTPFTAELQRSTEASEFEFRMAGHETLHQTTFLEADADLNVTLFALETHVGRRGRGKKRSAKKRIDRKGRKGKGKKGTDVKKGGIKDDLFGD